jgi:hypothetical protein
MGFNKSFERSIPLRDDGGVRLHRIWAELTCPSMRHFDFLQLWLQQSDKVG